MAKFTKDIKSRINKILKKDTYKFELNKITNHKIFDDNFYDLKVDLLHKLIYILKKSNKKEVWF